MLLVPDRCWESIILSKEKDAKAGWGKVIILTGKLKESNDLKQLSQRKPLTKKNTYVHGKWPYCLQVIWATSRSCQYCICIRLVASFIPSNLSLQMWQKKKRKKRGRFNWNLKHIEKRLRTFAWRMQPGCRGNASHLNF